MKKALSEIRAAGASGSLVINDIEPRQMSEGIFSGVGSAKNGEKFYLEMALITETNQADWIRYKEVAHQMANSGRSEMMRLIRGIHPMTTEDGDVYYAFRDEEGNTYDPTSGFSEEEFSKFINWLGQSGYFCKSLKSVSGMQFAILTDKARSLGQNSEGSAHLDLSLGQYITYATKIPHFDIKSVSMLSSGSISVKEFFSIYSNILMVTGSDFHGTGNSFLTRDIVVDPHSYHTRGIFRNPHSVIENTYKGIAMQLHGFTAAVAQKFFPDKKEMMVRPIWSMGHLIVNALKPEDITIKGFSIEEIRALKEKNWGYSHQTQLITGGEFPTMAIKIDALATLYYESSAQVEESSNLPLERHLAK